MLLEAKFLFHERGLDKVKPINTVISPKYHFPIIYHSSIIDKFIDQERIIGDPISTLRAEQMSDILPVLFEGKANTVLKIRSLK